MNTEEFETRLILEVESHQCIYDKSVPSYKNKKADAWNQISRILTKPVSDCQKKWGNLRDTFARLFRKEQEIPSGSGCIAEIKWKHYQQLQFLSDFTRIPRMMSNFEPECLTPLNDSTPRTELLNSEDDLVEVIQEIEELEEECQNRPTPKRRRTRSHDMDDKILEAISSVKMPEITPPKPLEQFFFSLAKQAEGLSKDQQLRMQIQCLQVLQNLAAESSY